MELNSFLTEEIEKKLNSHPDIKNIFLNLINDNNKLIKENNELKSKINLNKSELDNDFNQYLLSEKIVDNMPAMLWITDKDGQCTYINKQWCDYTETTLEENLGAGWLKYIHPEDLEKSGNIFIDANKKQTAFSLLYRLRRNDGEYRWAIDSGLPKFDEEGNFAGYNGIVTDIHDIKIVEDDFKKNEQYLESKIRERTLELENERSALRELFINTPAIICILRGPEHVFEFTNPGYQRLYGYRQLDGLPIRQALPEIEGQGFFELLDDVYNSGKSFIGKEMQAFVDSNNNGILEELYFNLIYHPIFDKNNKSVGITVFAFEITEQVMARKKVEELNKELTASEAKYKALSESLEIQVQERTEELSKANKQIELERQKLHSIFMAAPAAISIVYGPDYIYSLVNSSYSNLIGDRDYIGKKLLDIVPEAENQEIMKVLDNVYKTGVAFIGKEYPVMLDSEGTGNLKTYYFNFIYQPIFDSNKNVEGIISFGFDISESVLARKNTEYLLEQLNIEKEALKNSEEMFRFLANNIPQFVWIANSKGKLEYLNQRWYDFTGLSFENTKNIGLSKILNPEQVDEIYNKWNHSMKTGEPYEIECQYKNVNDNKYYWFLTQAMPLRNENNEIIKWFGTSTNINHHKEIERKLRTVNEELNSFTYIASHDLQTPLRTISSYLGLIQRRLKNKLSEEESNLLNIVLNANGTMKTLIEDLLAYSKSGSEQKNLHKIDLNNVIKDVLLLLDDSIKTTNAKIMISKLPLVNANYSQMIQLFQNILSNSLKYVSSDVEPIINISCETKDNCYFISITDNGIGIETEYYERIFEPFKRLHGPEKYTGSGIGLATVKRIVENHNGSINVESKLGKGTTFIICFKI